MTRQEIIEEIKWYYDQLNMPYSSHEFEEMTDKQLEVKLENLDEFDPCPDV